MDAALVAQALAHAHQQQAHAEAHLQQVTQYLEAAMNAANTSVEEGEVQEGQDGGDDEDNTDPPPAYDPAQAPPQSSQASAASDGDQDGAGTEADVDMYAVETADEQVPLQDSTNTAGANAASAEAVSTNDWSAPRPEYHRLKHPYYCNRKHPREKKCQIYFPTKLRDAAPHLYPAPKKKSATVASERGIARHDQQIAPTFLANDERIPGPIRNLIRSNKVRQSRGLMQGREYYTNLSAAVSSYRTDGRQVKSRCPKVGTLKTIRPSQVITDDDGYPIDHELLQRIEQRGAELAQVVIDEVRDKVSGWNNLVNYSGMARGGQGGRNTCCTGSNGALLRAAKKLMADFPILERCTDNFKAILIIFWAGYRVFWSE